MGKRLTQREKLARQLANTLNISEEEALALVPDIPEPESQVPRLESIEERMMEAYAVFSYIKDPDRFFIETCLNCKGKFVYQYHYRGIKMCSIECMAESLRALGMTWTIDRELHLRWDRYAPAVVPAHVLDLIEKHRLAQDPSELQTSISESENIETEQTPEKPSSTVESSLGLLSELDDLLLSFQAKT